MAKNTIQELYVPELLKGLQVYNYLNDLMRLDNKTQKKRKKELKLKKRKDLLHKNMDKKELYPHFY